MNRLCATMGLFAARSNGGRQETERPLANVRRFRPPSVGTDSILSLFGPRGHGTNGESHGGRSVPTDVSFLRLRNIEGRKEKSETRWGTSLPTCSSHLECYGFPTRRRLESGPSSFSILAG